MKKTKVDFFLKQISQFEPRTVKTNQKLGINLKNKRDFN